MMKRATRTVILSGLLGAAALFVSWPASAGTTIYKDDCYECQYRSFIGVPRDTCITAGHEEWGSLQCMEDSFGLQSLCWLQGDPCFNIIVTPGGGGGGGGGGGTSCSPPVGGYCPVSCWSCTIMPSYRPVGSGGEETETPEPIQPTRG